MEKEWLRNRFAARNFSEAAFSRKLQSTSPDTVPGTRFAYSNTGAQRLGILLQRVCHPSSGQLVRRYITRPHHVPDPGLAVRARRQPRYAPGFLVGQQKLVRWREEPRGLEVTDLQYEAAPAVQCQQRIQKLGSPVGKGEEELPLRRIEDRGLVEGAALGRVESSKGRWRAMGQEVNPKNSRPACTVKRRLTPTSLGAHAG